MYHYIFLTVHLLSVVFIYSVTINNRSIGLFREKTWPGMNKESTDHMDLHTWRHYATMSRCFSSFSYEHSHEKTCLRGFATR